MISFSRICRSASWLQTNARNMGKTAPKIVDPTTPGRSCEFPAFWSSLFDENAIKGSGKIID